MNILIITISLLVLIILILLYKPLGGIPNKKDIKNYEKRSINFKNKKFINDKLYTNWNDPYKNKTTNKGVKPKETLKVKKYTYKENKNK